MKDSRFYSVYSFRGEKLKIYNTITTITFKSLDIYMLQQSKREHTCQKSQNNSCQELSN